MSRSCATRRCTPRSWTRSSGRFARVCARRRSTPSPRRLRDVRVALRQRHKLLDSPSSSPSNRKTQSRRTPGRTFGKHAMVPLAHARASQTVTATRRRVPIRASRSASSRDSPSERTETRRRRRRERGRFRRVRVRVLVEDVPRRIEGCVSDVRSRARLGVRRGRDGERHAPRTRVRRRRRARIVASDFRLRNDGEGTVYLGDGPGPTTTLRFSPTVVYDERAYAACPRRSASRVGETRGTRAKIGTPRKTKASPRNVGKVRGSRPNDRARRERERERRRRRGRVERDGARRFRNRSVAIRFAPRRDQRGVSAFALAPGRIRRRGEDVAVPRELVTVRWGVAAKNIVGDPDVTLVA